jgi:hypothetical protein
MAMRGFVSVGIMHSLSVEFVAMLGRMLAAIRHRSVIAMTIIVVMVDVTVEVVRPVEPGSGTNEDAAIEPLRAIISIRSAVVGRHFVVSIGASGGLTDLNGNLCRCLRAG